MIWEKTWPRQAIDNPHWRSLPARAGANRLRRWEARRVPSPMGLAPRFGRRTPWYRDRPKRNGSQAKNVFQLALADALGVRGIELVVGGSMGGAAGLGVGAPRSRSRSGRGQYCRLGAAFSPVHTLERSPALGAGCRPEISPRRIRPGRSAHSRTRGRPGCRDDQLSKPGSAPAALWAREGRGGIRRSRTQSERFCSIGLASISWPGAGRAL